MLWLRHAVDDERDEEDVGEGGVDASVQGNPPLLAEPGRVVDTCTVGRPAIDQELVPLNSFINSYSYIFIYVCILSPIILMFIFY